MKDLLIKPLITEKFTKSNERAEKHNGTLAGKPRRNGRSALLHPTKEMEYAFQVDKSANKIEIKKAVESMYGVTVSAVRTQNYIGKVKYRYTKTGITKGRVNQIKKAIVSLKAGDSIDFFENI